MELKIQEIPENQNINKKNLKNIKNNISYDTILNNMGMTLVDGKLVFYNKNNNNNTENNTDYNYQYNNDYSYLNQNINSNSNSNFNIKQQQKQSINKPIDKQLQNSYIYNKYFKNEINNNNEPLRPKNIQEYKLMLIKNIIEKERIKRIKSKNLLYYSKLPYLDNINSNVNSNVNSNINLNKINENKLGKLYPHKF